MSRSNHHRRASSVSSLSCSSFDTNEEQYMASEKNWFATNPIVPLPTPANNGGQRMQTEMTILACSSPEIQALHKAYYATTTTKTTTIAPKSGRRHVQPISNHYVTHTNARPTSPTSSITSYSSLSRSNAVLILSSLDQISRNENDAMLISDHVHTSEQQQFSNSYSQYRHDHNMPRPMLPPTLPPTRNNLMFGSHEIAPQSSYRSLELPFPNDSHGSYHDVLNRSSSERLFPQTSLRKPSFHRRVSHDSLPSPTEIASFPPAVMVPPPPPSSTRLYHGRNSARMVHPSRVPDYPTFPC